MSITERIQRYENMGYTNDEAYDKVYTEEWQSSNEVIEHDEVFEIDCKLNR